jgi:hypothetical protein
MLFDEHENDREVNASVAKLLGESVQLVRQRGFHVVDTARRDDEPDVVDMAELTGGLDWDRDLEPRIYVRFGRRKRRAA